MKSDTLIMRTFDEFMFLNKLGMIALGIWPLDRRASWLRACGWKMQLIVLYFFMGFLLCAQCFDVYFQWGKVNSEIFLSNALTIFAVMMKHSSFLKNTNTFKDILQTMRTNWLRIMRESHNKDLISKAMTRARNWSYKYFLVVMVYITMPLLRDNTFREYAFFGRYFTERDSKVIYLCQILMSSTIGLANYATDTVFLVCTYQLCAQLQVLQNDLMDLSFDDNMDTHGRLISLIKRHQAEIRSAQALQSMFSQIGLQQILLSSLMISLHGFKLIVSPINHEAGVVVRVTYLILSLLQMLCYCHPGHELIIQSQSLDEAIFESDWINMDKDSVKDLIFMIQKSQKPLAITVGKIYVLSLQNFMRTVKMSVSVLSVVQGAYRRYNDRHA